MLYLFQQLDVSDFFAYRRWTIFETNQLDKHGRKHLICFYIITNLISSSIHCIAKIGLFSVDIMFTICSLIFYSHDHITLIQLINTVPGIIILSLYIDFMIGLLCHSINFVIFIIEFFKIWLNKLFSLFNQMNKRIKRRKELMKRMYWNQFHNQYIKLFAEIGYFNHTVSTLLLCIEFISKSAIMMSCIYYSRQEKMGVHNTTCIICFLSAFFYATSLYVIISGLHSANYSYTISILNWLARSQHNRYELNSNIWNCNVWSYMMIKSNLFTQTMMNNRLGFYCGQSFFVTRYKCLQLFLLNFSNKM
uniref:Uncharacterized protein LOC113794363 n=1 Tax=Dermatophagoides pteronyssinus TaxID=6956 RepID=A0A6P6Y470_DERPT|nr:uncharacterized protein LOC113794363 [Dermatophagoides pteronyssinus]